MNEKYPTSNSDKPESPRKEKYKSSNNINKSYLTYHVHIVEN
jgi:hypothetical protein